ncbi:MAG TPA: MFS transporter [Dermatophilaceae bacterium]|jgi:MFS family permease|nr:MFS transporter [Dermatophilaceae bacterium]HOA58946.1 MFS transporter [Dermatophilaceae bacterium]HPZ68458.1 MFS transporter [Dermatophilaceae bacterium]HQD00315.1 MFS transporter [Dermatophilaceae bacterium]
MHLGAYRHVIALPAVRSVLLLGFLVRMPMFATGIVLTLHVVTTLGRSYGEAGLVSAAFTIALAVSAPWRGRLLDRHGLRRVVAPSIVATGLVWTTLPFLPYAVLLPASVLGGLFVVPTFSILRQALLAAVPEDRRRTALSLDSVFIELSFMIAPAVAVWAAATYDTQWVLLAVAILNLVAASALYVVNPPITPEAVREVGATVDAPGDKRWVSVGALAVLAAAAATSIVLAGTDVSIVAALRETGDTAAIGWVLSVWGAGSLVGGLVYGAWHRSISVFWLLAGLAASTVPVALAGSLPWLVVLLFLCGVLCAPTITATLDHLARLVPEGSRGEAMGWHGSAMTAGQAIGAPLAGFAIDHAGWGWGFVSVSLVALAIAVVGGVAERIRRATRLRPA